MNMEQAQCSETSAIEHHKPENNQKGYTGHTEHGESLKSRIKHFCYSTFWLHTSHPWCSQPLLCFICWIPLWRWPIKAETCRRVYSLFWVIHRHLDFICRCFGTECSETLSYKIPTPGNHPKERMQHSKHGESLKSRLYKVDHTLCFIVLFLLLVYTLYTVKWAFVKDW
jgi:hypothetical protein